MYDAWLSISKEVNEAKISFEREKEILVAGDVDQTLICFWKQERTFCQEYKAGNPAILEPHSYIIQNHPGTFVHALLSSRRDKGLLKFSWNGSFIHDSQVTYSRVLCLGRGNRRAPEGGAADSRSLPQRGFSVCHWSRRRRQCLADALIDIAYSWRSPPLSRFRHTRREGGTGKWQTA